MCVLFGSGNGLQEIVAENCCVAQVAPLYIPSLPGTRPMTMKKKGWLDWGVKSRKRYVLQPNPAQDWRGGSLREKERSCCHWFSLLFVPRPNGECFLSSSWLSLFLSVSPLSVCGDGTFLVQLSCRQTRETLSLAYFLRRVINFVSFASASIVLSQAGGRRDRVLLLGNLTPIPLHFQRNPRHVYLFILLCVSPASGRSTNCQD